MVTSEDAPELQRDVGDRSADSARWERMLLRARAENRIFPVRITGRGPAKDQGRPSAGGRSAGRWEGGTEAEGPREIISTRGGDPQGHCCDPPDSRSIRKKEKSKKPVRAPSSERRMKNRNRGVDVRLAKG